jgi:hypothetical protein
MQVKSKGAKADKARGGKPQNRAAARQGQERLRRGQLDRLVLGYMKKHKGELPARPEVARGIKRSSGAAGNCLGRLEQTGEVQLIDKKRGFWI